MLASCLATLLKAADGVGGLEDDPFSRAKDRRVVIPAPAEVEGPSNRALPLMAG